MDRVGVLVVSYGSRESAIVEALKRSEEYDVDLYIVDRQRNPFNLARAREHVVVPDLDVGRILSFAERFRGEIDFGIVGPEKPIIEGVRDLVEGRTGIPVICPTREFAIEGSKVAQRLLFQDAVPEANPRFKAFDPREFSSIDEARRELDRWLDELDNRVAVKPDAPAAGKGVGVWGDHFTSREQIHEHFAVNYREGAVIVEEKLEGEESSFQALCDGEHLIPLPETRDYKRAFDGDRGPNTGGMGSYKDVGECLPFMTRRDREREVEIVERIFRRLKGRGRNPGLIGMPFYVAFMHTREGPKILENNSRFGDPEILNILPILKDDFVDLCYRMLEGNLKGVDVQEHATVATYKVPPSYGGYMEAYPERVRRDEVGTPMELEEAERLASLHGGRMRIYPGSVELRDGKIYALRSRAICVVGIGDTIEEARGISLEGIEAIRGGGLWNRTDIASREHIGRSIAHMEKLRGR
jgi:phosphoribosylamine--glycine ligase